VSEITKELISRLEVMSTNTCLPLERRMIDTAVWFHKNKDRIPREALDKRVDFLEKTVDIFLEMMAMSMDRIQKAEGRRKSDSLWLPNGMTMTGDVREFD
tara:strand:+ start:540 stop:839 length:300 start_codon:yes stop_codon:yes gene_type:complete